MSIDVAKTRQPVSEVAFVADDEHRPRLSEVPCPAVRPVEEVGSPTTEEIANVENELVSEPTPAVCDVAEADACTENTAVVPVYRMSTLDQAEAISVASDSDGDDVMITGYKAQQLRRANRSCRTAKSAF